MAEKVVTMVLNTVDLESFSCNKVNKVLCKFPQIIDQVYDVKNCKVFIKVLCCSPEKIRDKLCSKGGKAIKSIEIVDDAEKSKMPEKPKEAEKPKAPEKPKEATKPKEAEKPKAPEAPEPVQGYQHMPMYPNGGPCYQGYGRPVPQPPRPCYNHGQPVPQPPRPCYNHGRPVPPPPRPCYNYGQPVPQPPRPCYNYGRPVPPPPRSCYNYGQSGPSYDYGYGYRGSKYFVNTDYFSDENTQGCTIM